MSYCIGNLIYGIPVTQSIANLFEKNHDIELEDLGFEILYSAGAETVGYLGFDCAEFDECTDIFPFSQLENSKKKVTPEIEGDVKELVRNAMEESPELAKILVDENINIDYYIVWSSS